MIASKTFRHRLTEITQIDLLPIINTAIVCSAIARVVLYLVVYLVVIMGFT